jgi:hypothetical protein
MNYPEHTKAALPIGSDVTEAACKTLVKQRLCGSGMRWSKPPGRWESYWQKIQQVGVPAII